MKKCKCCQIDDIEKIEYCDLLCEKCNKCNYLIFKGDQLELFIINLIQYFNVGNIKKYYDLSSMTDLESAALYSFLRKMNTLVQAFYNLKFKETNFECTICRRYFM